MYQYPDYLMHYGVLGMKWGRRRERRAAKKEAKAKKKEIATDAKKATAKTARGVVNAATGNIGRASATAIVLYAAARYTGADKVVAAYAKQTVSSVMDSAKGAKVSRDIWNNMAKNYMKNKK